MSDPSQPHGLAAYQAPPSMELSRQEDWSALPLPSPLTTGRTLNLYLFKFL